jgi:DNA-binding FrmR family transcriptional regulator
MEYNSKIINRLKRAEGQMRGVLNIMEEGKDCVDVVTQLSAVRASIDKLIGVIVAENLVHCITEDHGDGLTQEEKIQQAINLLVKSR